MRTGRVWRIRLFVNCFDDLGLFEMVGHPVAVYPDKRLKALAAERGWPVLG